MKVILSKKGFDGIYGGFASPILPSGRLISLPVPALSGEDKRIKYRELCYDKNQSLIDLLAKMAKQKIKIPWDKEKKSPRNRKYRWEPPKNIPAHLDPDLCPKSYPRKLGWRGLFGIHGSYQTHIENETEGKGLEPGDLFLFFGWFEKYRYDSGGKLVNFENKRDYRTGRHVIFGYLQIDTILPLYKMRDCDARIEKWMDYHPHIGENRKFVGDGKKFPKNTLYVARSKLVFAPGKPGFGLFRYDDDSADALTLTKKGHTRTQWQLPRAFTTPKQVKISRNPNGWTTWKKEGCFQSVKGYGQEFVIHEEGVEVEKWAKSLIHRFANG
jgi:hypothetical protein